MYLFVVLIVLWFIMIIIYKHFFGDSNRKININCINTKYTTDREYILFTKQNTKRTASQTGDL